MKTENWNGHQIRFVEYNGEHFAILKDICDALELRTDAVVKRLDDDMVVRLAILEGSPRAGIGKMQTRQMVCVTELGIYEAIFASRKPEARAFRRWTTSVLKKLREKIGLADYEVMKMLDPETQDEITRILDTLYWDEEKQCVMQSITVPGGDVEQVKFLD